MFCVGLEYALCSGVTMAKGGQSSVMTEMVQSAGLEPATYRFEAGNSIH
jgi:hypothetical protein